MNDGRSLEMVSEDSIDFAFSFDSLVHVEADVLRGYLVQLRRKLRPDGVGFLHHSNAGAFPDPATGALSIANPHWRATSVTAREFARWCAEAGLRCIAQEIVDWEVPDLTDCFSLFTPVGSRFDRAPRVVENRQFMEEVAYLRRRASLYAPEGLAAPGAGARVPRMGGNAAGARTGGTERT